MSRTIRRQLAADLQPLMPSTKIVPSSRALDTLTEPVVQITLQEFARLPEAPIGAHQMTFTVTVVSPKAATQEAEDQLDTLVGDLVYGIDTIEHLRWELARKVIYNDRYLAYDVTVIAVTEKN